MNSTLVNELKSEMREANPKVVEMFDSISSTYDSLNRFFSLGIDKLWRRHAIRSLGLMEGMRILDCSSGTGDMSIEAHRQCRGVHTTMLDPASQMLLLAEAKAKRHRIKAYDLMCGAAERIEIADGSFDCFMVAFGIRNFQNLEIGLHELHRVLRPGGKGVILEFTPDRSVIIDRMFRVYLRWIMRPVGGAVSNKKDAYKYLAETIQRFPSSKKLVDVFEATGFSEVDARPLSFGIATQFLVTK